MEKHNGAVEHINLGAFYVSGECGFVLEQPATDLPEYYRIWMELASNLTHLIHTHQLRDLVHEIPVLSLDHLKGHRDLRLAHLALGFITMGYVWQEGDHLPAQVLPKALALPLWLVSKRLGLPPILTFADCVLANWKLKDPARGMNMGNLDLVFSFPGVDSCRGFLLVSLLVEKAGSSGIQGALEVMNAMASYDIIKLQKGLDEVVESLKEMKEMFKLMHLHVDSTIFHGTLRAFFSGWRDNPMLPGGLRYDGVSDTPVLLSGGSAAQSPCIQCFDALFGVRHDDQSDSFLKRMRDYMLPSHRQVVEALSLGPSLQDYVLSCSSGPLRHTYNSCVLALADLRTYHLCAVARYITVPGNRARAAGVRGALDGTGTGGTSPMEFLKSVRDATLRALISDN